MKKITFTFLLSFFLSVVGYSQTVVSSLAELRSAVTNSNQNIVMQPGNYNLEDSLPEGSRVIECTGSNNIIDLTGVYLQATVGIIKSVYFSILGDNNTVIGGEFEDVYSSGITEVTDFSAYNQDRTNLAAGLDGGAVVRIDGNDNLINGLKLTTRGSFPYGYGSMYGIGAVNTFGLDKRCGILITGGDRNTIDNVELQHRAFGHGIYIQGGSTGSVIKNTLVEGRVRASAELYEETNSYDLPYRTDYLMPHWDNEPVPIDGVHTLCEDGIRAYSGTGSVTVENCTVKKMRGGIRLYLASSATVTNSTAIDCGTTNWNMPSGGTITNSSGNFAYATLSDFRLSRSNQDIEWTIIPSPHATGDHNMVDVLGNNHNIVFHRTPGPVDADEERAIIISGDNSTIINETEYTIILEASASGNTITTCGRVIDYGSSNTLIESSSCSVALGCHNTADNLQAECYDTMSGVVVQDITGMINEKGITDIQNNDYIVFEDIDLTETVAVNVTAATSVSGTSVEVRAGSFSGTLLATISITNTSSYDTYQEFTANLTQSFNGQTDIYFVFIGGAGSLLNIDKMDFEYASCYLASYQAATVTSAKDFCEASGITVITNTNATEVVSDINNGDYLRFSNVNFGVVGYNTVKVSAASGALGGTIEVRSGGIDGALITTIEVENTGDWNTHDIFEGFITSDFTGMQDLYLVFTGGSGALLNLENFQFYQDNCVELVSTNAQVNAEDFCEDAGATIKDAGEGGQYISAARDGDYFGYGIFDFNANQLNEFQVTFAKSSVKDTFIELRLDSPTGTLIATIDATDYAGGSQNWTTESTTSIQPVTGVHKLYIVIRGQANTSLVNFNWFSLLSQSLSVNNTSFIETTLFPNPASETITISNAKNATLEVYNLNGMMLKREELTTEDTLINLSKMASGLYLFRLKNEDGIAVKKVIKQ